MAAAAPVAPPDLAGSNKGVKPLRAGQGHSFLWRRLHSLSGIIPIGAFLVEHIVSNFETWNGPLAYAQQVKLLNSLPLVRFLEWGLIFIPLAFHALYGVWISFRGRVNVNVYPWASNWMYITQRVTGIIALAYIIQHVVRQRFMGVQLPEHPGAAFAKVQHELSNPWMLAIYVVAMIATTWHFAYGIWLFCAKWGITPGDKARKRDGLRLRRHRLGPLSHGPHQHLRRRLQIPQCPPGCHARAAGRSHTTSTKHCATKLNQSIPAGRNSVKIQSIHDIHPHFYVACLGILLGILAQEKIERDLVSQHAMPQTVLWQRSSRKHLSAVFQAHRQRFPKSVWRTLVVFGYVLFFSSIVIFFFER